MRSRCVHAMKRSKPSTVVGGGEMKRATSSVVSIASSEGASSLRSSRSVNVDPAITGSAVFQFGGRPCVCCSRRDHRRGSLLVQFGLEGHLFHYWPPPPVAGRRVIDERLDCRTGRRTDVGVERFDFRGVVAEDSSSSPAELPHDDVVVAAVAPHDVVDERLLPQTMLSRPSALPHTMLSSSLLPQTMLSQSAPPQSLPHTMLSSAAVAPDDVVRRRCPRRCCRRRSCPTRCCRHRCCPRRCCRSASDSPQTMLLPQTMLSQAAVSQFSPQTMFCPAGVSAVAPHDVEAPRRCRPASARRR